MVETNRNVLVSVLMSVYNEPKDWIDVAINSILCQTYSNIEFIIVNDAPERLLNKRILAEYQRADNRIVIVHNEQNIGLAKSLNKALYMARGEFVARMDADDYSFPNRLEVQIDFFRNNSDIIACGTFANLFIDDKIIDQIKLPIDMPDIYFQSFTSVIAVHPTLMICKNKLLEFNIKYDESFILSQDYKLELDILQYGKIKNIPRVLLNYRNSLSGKNKNHLAYSNYYGNMNRRIAIDRFYNKYGIEKLPQNISLKNIKDNYEYETEIISNIKMNRDELYLFKISMNCIRRVLYMSLDEYSFRSVFLYLSSLDYIYKPYNFKRFVAVIMKPFLKINLI